MEDNSKPSGESQSAVGVIYKITCLINGKSYVGQTRQKFEVRISQHKHNSNRTPIGIDAAIKKYGWENFTVEIIEECAIEKLDEREMFWIVELNSKAPNGYNLTDGGDGCKGYTPTAKTRAKRAKSLKGRKFSAETLAKMSAAKKGKPSNRKGAHLSEAHKAKISAAKKGSTPHNKGKHLSEEQKAVLSALNKGENNPNYGKHHSPETIAKIAESNRRTWARKKLESQNNS